MIKLIASDLDGTLLQDGTQELTPRAISLIHSLTQKGIYFVAASGRQYTNERIVFDKIKDENFLYWRERLNLYASGQTYFPRNDQR